MPISRGLFIQSTCLGGDARGEGTSRRNRSSRSSATRAAATRVPTKSESGSTKARMSTLVLGGPPARTTMDRRRRPRPAGLALTRTAGRPSADALPPRRGWMDRAARAREAMDGRWRLERLNLAACAGREWDRTMVFVLSILPSVPRRPD